MPKKEMPPIHPGKVLKEKYLDPLKVTVTTLAISMGVARRTISLIVNGHARISPDMALRLAKAFNNSPGFWMNLQCHYDLWEASRKISISGIPNLIEIKSAAAKGRHNKH